MQKSFIDTNLWMYAFIDSSENSKRERILDFLENKRQTEICLSVQVINEFHWALSRKFKVPENIIAIKVKSILELSTVYSLSFSTYLKSIEIRSKYNISFWDSLLVSSALENNVENFYSEDLQDGLMIDGIFKVINPFA